MRHIVQTDYSARVTTYEDLPESMRDYLRKFVVAEFTQHFYTRGNVMKKKNAAQVQRESMVSWQLCDFVAFEIMNPYQWTRDRLRDALIEDAKARGELVMPDRKPLQHPHDCRLGA